MDIINSFYFDSNLERMAEIKTALRKNLNNAFIKNLHIFVTPWDKELVLESEIANYANFEKINFIPYDSQPTYYDLFSYAVTLKDKICCICNSDIELVIDFTTGRMLTEKLKTSKLIYFLTRHEHDGSHPLIDTFGGSHDAFVFASGILRNALILQDLGALQYVQNTPGIESILTIFFIEKLGYTIQNPCFQLKLIHHHRSNIRNWAKGETKSVGYTWPVSLGWPGVHCDYMIRPQYLKLDEGSFMSGTLFEILNAAELPPPQGILQVGASYGQELQSFVEAGITSALLIEPLPEPFAHIAAFCKRTEGFIAFNALCSDSSGEKHKFHVASNGGQSSSIMKPNKHLEMFDFVKFEETIEILSSTVDEIVKFLEQHGHGPIIKQLDTLYLDVQGAEFKVLLGAPRTLRQINYIFAELIRGELYEDAVSLANYCALLDAQGFTLNYINFNKYHHADMLFVRKSLLSL